MMVGICRTFEDEGGIVWREAEPQPDWIGKGKTATRYNEHEMTSKDTEPQDHDGGQSLECDGT